MIILRICRWKKEWGAVPRRGERRELEKEKGEKKMKKRRRKIQSEDRRN